jgi:hypothetical protein
MTAQPDFEAFPRFRDLNVKNLLYFQVELDDLRDQLMKREKEDWSKWRTSGNEARNFAKHADSLIDTQYGTNPKDRKQWELVLKIRERLNEYSKISGSYNADVNGRNRVPTDPA